MTNFFVPNTIYASKYSNSLELAVGNSTFRWLVDTGASVSAVKYETVLQLNIPIHRQISSISGIGGNLYTEGIVYIELSVNGRSLCHKFHVLRNLTCVTSGILGQDFLRKYKSVIDLEHNTVTLNIHDSEALTLPLQLGLLGKNSYITVPPRCEKIFYVDTEINEDCLVISNELCNGVYLAGGLCRPHNGKIPIQLLNTRENEVCLSYFQPPIQRLSQYNICTYENSHVDGDRVRKMFSFLELSHLNKEEKTSIQNICAKFADIFYIPGDSLTPSRIDPQNIHLKPNVAPVFVKQYRLPHSQRTELEHQVKTMLSEKIIEPSHSAWSSPVLLVPKQPDAEGNKKWRLVIDFRKLNEQILDDKFPLPNIHDILDSLSGSMYFSHLDLHQGFFQLKLNEQSRPYTAFTTPSGHYQLTRLPMGLKTSPSCFSRAMTIAMSGLNYEKCLIYMDDLVCYGRNLDTHNKNLMDIFSRLRKFNLKLNPAKCEFLKKEILYLGHLVSAEGIKPDPNKVAVLQNYPEPKNAEDVKRFVAFSNYYRKFIPNFAKLCIPLNNLTRKNIQFNWNEDCKQAFLSLKKALSLPPVLQYPDFSENNTFILKTDASGIAVGSLLCNSNRNPVAYASRSLNKAERNYPTIEKELLAIVWSIKYFRPYLYGRRFIVQTDHKPLVYLFSMTNPSSRLIKFRLILEEYDFSVEYVKGSDNVQADALSRIILTSNDLIGMNKNIISVLTRAQRKRMSQVDSLQTNTSDDKRTDHPRVVEVLRHPKEFTELRFLTSSEWQSKSKTCDERYDNLAFDKKKLIIYIQPVTRSHRARGAFARELSRFCAKIQVDDLYIFRNNNNITLIKELAQDISNMVPGSGPRLCVLKGTIRIDDSDTQRVILNDYHMLPTSGHAGIRRMSNNIRQRYFWPGLDKDVAEFVKRCDKCQRQKHFKNTKEPMVITTTGNCAFDRVFLDLVGPLVKDSNNYVYILTLQCDLTKYVEAYPLVTKETTSVASALVNNFILRYGIPREIITDRGTEFISNTMQEVCKLLKITQLTSTSYHHQTIGSLENSHKHLISYLRTQTNNETDNWSSWLPFWCFAYNTTVHSETRYTPHELVFGKPCNIPSNLCNAIDPLYNFNAYPNELKYRLQKSQYDAKCNLLKTKELRKIQYDSYVNPVTYKSGDLILIKNEAISNKLDPLYKGPYTVIREHNPNVVISNKGKEVTVHKNRTKLYTP